MDRIRFQNYRCFDDTGDIELKPLTFLLGANSSGKSSFLEFFPLLKQSVGVRRNGVFLWYSNDVDFKDFDNAVKAGEDIMTISWQYDDFAVNNIRNTKSLKKVVADNSFFPTKIQLRISLFLSARKDNFDKLDKLKIEFLDEEISILISEDGKVTTIVNGREIKDDRIDIRLFDSSFLLPMLILSYKADGEGFPSYYRIFDRLDVFSSEYMKDLKEMMLTENMLFLQKDDYVSLFKKIVKNENVDYDSLRDYYLFAGLEEIMELINYRIQAESSRISYVKPLRVTPERYYRYQNYSVDDIDSDGKNLAMFLANLSEAEMKKFQAWTNKNFGIKIYTSKHEGHVELTIGHNKKDARNLVDVGFGYTQLLPIITIIWNALRNTEHHYYYPRVGNPIITIAIEQPELHLHPKVQSLFAECLAKVITTSPHSSNVRFIIETHSEVIINRIGAIIQADELDDKSVNVVLFNTFGKESDEFVIEASFDKDGYLTRWPLGFFLS